MNLSRTALFLLVPLCPLISGPLHAAGVADTGQEDAPPAEQRESVGEPVQLTYEELVAEFAAREDELRDAAKAVPTGSERNALRAERKALPALFWPRMQTAADAGEGRALLWMAINAKKAGVPKAELAETKRALYSRLLDEHEDAPWLGEALQRMATDRRELGTEGAVELLTRVHASEQAAPETRSEAAFLIASAYELEQDPVASAKAVAWYRRVADEFPNTERAAQAEQRIFTVERLQIGMVAPEIEGADLDGVAFKLSDYRGKVVVLDFWGDW